MASFIRAPSPLSVGWALLLLLATACESRPQHHPHAPVPHAEAKATPLERVAAIHGAPGPFAVAGFRMGERALRELGLPAGSFDLEATHESPAEVQWSCIADGVQAATGASAGKLNLHMAAVPRPQMRTVFRRKSTGQTVVFKLAASFEQRFLDVPRERLPAAGAEVLALPDDQIFTVDRP